MGSFLSCYAATGSSGSLVSSSGGGSQTGHRRLRHSPVRMSLRWISRSWPQRGQISRMVMVYLLLRDAQHQLNELNRGFETTLPQFVTSRKIGQQEIEDHHLVNVGRADKREVSESAMPQPSAVITIAGRTSFTGSDD
jgi:hypothetical protein